MSDQATTRRPEDLDARAEELPHVPFVAPTGVDADQLRRIIEEAPPRRLEPVEPFRPVDPLAALSALISEPPRVPELGVKAAGAMTHLFESVAVEIEAVAKAGVDRALEVQQDVLSFTAVLRQSGALLTQKIETEAAMTRQLALGVRLLRDAFPVPVLPATGE